MRFKNLALGLGITALATVMLLFTTQKQKNDDSQFPNHPEELTAPAEGINGAMQYLHLLRSNPATGDIDIKDVVAARKGLKNLSTAKNINLDWQEMGPSNVGGRVRAILVDTFHNCMFAGGVSGGLWKSTTNGQSWVQIGLDDNIFISCIAQSPVDGSIYVGTGEGLAAPSATNYNSGQYGNGVYKSTDGSSFTLLSNTSSWSLINRIAVDRNGKVFLATTNGLKSSSDGGTTWDNAFTGVYKDIRTATTMDYAIASTSSGAIYMNDNTTSATQTWTQLSTYPGAGTRTELAIAPSDENIIYGVTAASNGSLQGIYRSVDKGLNWELIGPGGSSSFELFGPNNQGWYDIAIHVHPTNPDLIFVGGINVWKGQKVVSNGPFAWTEISTRFRLRGDGTPSPHYIHADIHALVANPSNPDGFFVGSDGGISETGNNGATFVTKNINFSVTQFYAVACSPHGWAMGGTQDNSTPYVDGNGNDSLKREAVVLFSGDGGWSAFSSLSQDFLFATSQYGNIGRSNDHGDSWQYPTALDGTTPAFFNGAMIGNGVHENSSFVTPLLLWETALYPNSIDSVDYVADTTYAVGDTVWARSAENDHYPFPFISPKALNTGDIIKVQDPVESRFFAGLYNGVYMTDQALSFNGFPPRWYKIAHVTGQFTSVQNLALSKDGDVLFFVAGNNRLYRVSNLLASQDSTTLQYDEPGYALQQTLVKTFAGTITSIAIDPNDNNRVAVTLGGFSSSYAHVWYSQNATSASPTFVPRGGDLPSSLPVYSSLIPMNNSNTLIIGTEYGVYGTENLTSAAPTYVDMNGGIDDPVPVFMLRQQIYDQPWMQAGRWDNGILNTQVYPGITNYGEIYAATHGRGFFKSMTFTGFKEITGNKPSFKSDLKAYPNPAEDMLNIEFELNSSENVSYSVFNNNGQVVRTANSRLLPAGKNKIQIQTRDLRSGFYYVRLQTENQVKTAKIIVQ